ncbi:MAG: glycosyl hydrolase family 28 protein, partial [Synergistaceae bacterium]|nr:glycosyl hydrolase family 28 protein [Synergistaceae bacterium]
MFRKCVFAFLALSLVLLPVKAHSAVDDPFWPQSEYDRIENRILGNVPVVTDDASGYKFTVVDADGTRKEITYSVKLTDFTPRTSLEDVISARPAGTGTGRILTRTPIEDWTWAFRSALQDVADKGGGTVVVPTRAASYRTGAIRFRGNNTRIHLEDGVKIEFIRNMQYGTYVRTSPTTMLPPITYSNPADYDDWYPQEKTRYECRDFYGYSPLIYAYGLKNIALTGAGRGGDNPVTGDGRPTTDIADVDGNDYPDGYIEPEPGSKISIIDGMADSYHMRTFTVTLPLYDVDNTTVIVPSGTTATHRIDPNTDQAVVGTPTGSLTYSAWLEGKMNNWQPIESRMMPDLVPLSNPNLSDAQKQFRNVRRVNQYRVTFLEPHECQNVLIADFYLRNSPFWLLHPTYSQNIHIYGVHLNTHGTNNDGIDLDSSQYALVEKNIFNTGDDNVAVKCGRDNDGYQDWNMPSTHVIVRDNLMRDGHGGIVAGSEMAGGVEWVFAHNNIFDSPNFWYGLRIKTNSSRGGYLRHIYMKDTELRALMASFITLNFFYDHDSDTRVPTASDVYVSNCYTPPTGFTVKPKLGFIVAKQYGSSPVSGIHIKDCDLSGFYQSPNNPDNPNRPINNISSLVEGGISYDNVRIDGELYQPPAKSSTIKSLIFTNLLNTNDVRVVSKPEDLKTIIDESRANTSLRWDISIVAKVDGFDYKGRRYSINDTIENSTYSGPLDNTGSGVHEHYDGGTNYTEGRSPHIKDEDKRYPYYRVSGMPAYEAFVRVNSRHTIGTTNNVQDWYANPSISHVDAGPNYVIDLRTPGRVTPMGNSEYLIKLRENVDMGNTYAIRTGVPILNKIEVVLRNALFTDDQDFVFYSALPRITGTKIDAVKNLFVVDFDRPMNNAAIATLSLKLTADGLVVPVNLIGQWSSDGASVSFNVLDSIDAGKFYTIDAFDPTSKVLSYRGIVPILSGTAITSLTLNADNMLMKAGETFQLVPTIFPSDATLPITY